MLVFLARAPGRDQTYQRFVPTARLTDGIQGGMDLDKFFRRFFHLLFPPEAPASFSVSPPDGSASDWESPQVT